MVRWTTPSSSRHRLPTRRRSSTWRRTPVVRWVSTGWRTASTLKLDLAQFRELEAFATFGSELDKISAAQLERGYRLTELLKQNLNSPMPVQEQVVSIFAGTGGYLDDIPVSDVKRFELELL